MLNVFAVSIALTMGLCRHTLRRFVGIPGVFVPIRGAGDVRMLMLEFDPVGVLGSSRADIIIRVKSVGSLMVVICD